MPLRSLLAVVLVILGLTTPTTPATLAQTAAVDRPVELRGGTCDSLGEVVAPLANLVFASGDLQGQTGHGTVTLPGVHAAVMGEARDSLFPSRQQYWRTGARHLGHQSWALQR